jgi:paraquat-inducible protein B
MSKNLSPTVIGAFVVGAVALLIVAVIALGSGQLFRKTQNTSFISAVRSAYIGAGKFMGVKVGLVKDIRLEMWGQRSPHDSGHY